MSTWDEGDVATLDLAVSPSGPTTSATVAVRAPDGRLRSATPHPTDDARSQWTATVLVDEPGVWDVRWTVTGQGAGTEGVTFGVRPRPSSRPGRGYATSADLARWVGDIPPVAAPRLLAEASRVVDALLVGARYAVDDQGLPTSPAIVAALRDATCAQAAAQGDPDAGDADDRWSSVKIGSVQLTDTRAQRAAPDPTEPTSDTVEVLRVAGLLPIRPYVVG